MATYDRVRKVVSQLTPEQFSILVRCVNAQQSALGLAAGGAIKWQSLAHTGNFTAAMQHLQKHYCMSLDEARARVRAYQWDTFSTT